MTPTSLDQDQTSFWEFVGWWAFFILVFGVPWWAGVMTIGKFLYQHFAR